MRNNIKFLQMIPESYEREYNIWLIMTAFEVFLV